jgi:Ion channel
MPHAQRWRDRTKPLRVGSMAVLLALLVINVFVVPFTMAPDGFWAHVVRDMLLSLILLTGVAAVSDRRGQRAVIALVAGAAILVRLTGWLFSPGDAPSLVDASTLFALAILGSVIGIKVFSAGAVTFDRILGAVALYVLIGVVWAETYPLVYMHVPNAYAGIASTGGPPDRSTWVYFSFVTLTTVGYGDITPLAHAARSLTILEALIGQLYPAIVLARLVSLHAAGGRSGASPS